MQHPYLRLRSISLFLLAALLSACSTAESGGTSRNDDPKLIQNPVAVSPESLAKGKRLFDTHCADCHGEKADGVSAVAAAMAADAVRPPDLTDDKWDHGGTDGEIFVSIRDGVGGGGAMKGLNGRPGIGPTEMWQMVNYLRSLKR